MVKKQVVAWAKAKGAEFEIRKTGMNWTLYVKEKGKKRWDRVQSMANLLALKQVMQNQPEFKKLKKVM